MKYLSCLAVAIKILFCCLVYGSSLLLSSELLASCYLLRSSLILVGVRLLAAKIE
jgi:hypothetical protein